MAFLGIFSYVGQMLAGFLPTPWHVPVFAIVGALLVARAFWLRGTVLRVLGILGCLALAGLEVWFIFFYTALPTYSGPVAAGANFPEFEAVRADGNRFTKASWEGEEDSILIFYRGHW